MVFFSCSFYHVVSPVDQTCDHAIKPKITRFPCYLVFILAAGWVFLLITSDQAKRGMISAITMFWFADYEWCLPRVLIILLTQRQFELCCSYILGIWMKYCSFVGISWLSNSKLIKIGKKCKQGPNLEIKKLKPQVRRDIIRLFGNPHEQKDEYWTRCESKFTSCSLSVPVGKEVLKSTMLQSIVTLTRTKSLADYEKLYRKAEMWCKLVQGWSHGINLLGTI